MSASLRPWQDALAQLASGDAAAAAAASLPVLHDALAALASGLEAVPAELAAPQPATPLDGWLRRSARPCGFNDVRRRREALLRLGVWRALVALGETGGDDAGLLDALQVWMGRAGIGVPPGLGPALPYAGSASAERFFDRDLRAALARLAERHDPRGADFAPLARAQPYEATAVGVHAWAQAWSAAVAAVYLDWLRHAAQGSLARARQGLWHDGGVRFRAPSGLVVLPTRERAMHLDLWTDLVGAQALEHRAERFDAAARPWHRVRIAMHDLGERDRGGAASGGVRTIFRGLGVEMLYQTVFAGRALGALGARAGAAAMSPVDRAGTLPVVVDVPLPRPGQQANLELVLRWHDPAAADRGTRFAGDTETLRLSGEQQRRLAAWQQQRGGGAVPASALAAAMIDWRPAGAQDGFVDDAGRTLAALGHGALWRAAGDDADWLDFALVELGPSGWSELPVRLHDDAVDGAWRTWLLLDADRPAAEVAALRRAFADPARCCWVARRAGVGVFLMAGVAPGGPG